MERPFHSVSPRSGTQFRRALGLVAAAVSSIAVLGAGAAPALAATARIAHTSPAAVREMPEIVWTYKGQYPTDAKCVSAGKGWLNSGAAARYKCVEITKGSYFVWDLYIVVQ